MFSVNIFPFYLCFWTMVTLRVLYLQHMGLNWIVILICLLLGVTQA